jgi:hypothetical protein
MKRVNVDTAPLAVRKFIRSLAIEPGGVELSLGGNVVCRVIPPGQLSESEKETQLADVRRLLGEARAHSKSFPPAVIEQNIRNALKTVRGRR